MSVGARTKLMAIGALAAAAVVPAGAAASVAADFGPAADVRVHPETGKAAFVATQPGRALPAPTKDSAGAVGLAFLNDHASAFGLAGDNTSLSVSKVTPFDGGTSVRVQQEESGVPVIAGELIVNLDSAGEVLSVSGETSPSPRVASEPGISAGEAVDTAIAATAKHSEVDAVDLEASVPELSILDSRLLDGPDLGPTALVYRTEVTSPTHPDVNDFVAIDAGTGAIALKFSQIHTALERHHCDRNNVRANEPPCKIAKSLRDEGQGPSGISDLDEAYDYTGDIYDFLFDLGHDSLDDAGLPLYSTTRYCPLAGRGVCPYNNAFWNGQQMYYGKGLQADDVVGHELGHGFTQYTSNLFYYYQSGAINESLSDVFGELMDQTNGAGSDSPSDAWKLGEDISENYFVKECKPTDSGPELRNMQDPTLCHQPDSMSSRRYHTDETDSGGVHINSGINNKAAYLMVDGGSFNGQTVNGIGIPKVAAIYYHVQTTMLTSGSDYQTLAAALRQSCSNLIGSDGITAANCAEVDKAILAVEMDDVPAGAPNPKAPVCNGSDHPTNFFFDDFEGATDWDLSGGSWSYDTSYATSGDTTLFAPDLATVWDSSAVSPAIAVPASIPAGGVFFRFNHAYGFETDTMTNFDGGVLEYSTAGAGGPWTDAGSLITHVGYNGTIDDISTSANPLKGRQAFVAVSNGYRATRVNLASLAGDTVHFRFRHGSDQTFGFFPGWFVDDVRAYTCGASGGNQPPVLGSIGNKNATRGQPALVPGLGDRRRRRRAHLLGLEPAGGGQLQRRHPHLHLDPDRRPGTLQQRPLRGRRRDRHRLGGHHDHGHRRRQHEPPETTILSRTRQGHLQGEEGQEGEGRLRVRLEREPGRLRVQHQRRRLASPALQAIAVHRCRKGNWVLEARAVDAEGLVDPTPVSDTIKVKGRRKKQLGLVGDVELREPGARERRDLARRVHAPHGALEPEEGAVRTGQRAQQRVFLGLGGLIGPELVCQLRVSGVQ